MKTQSVVTNFNEHSDGIQALAFSENGYHMASAGLDGCVKLWDLRNGNCIQSLTMDSPINSIGFDYTGSYLGVAASDFTVYQSKSWEKVYQNQENMNGFYSMSFGPSAKYVYVGCGNRSVVKLSQQNCLFDNQCLDCDDDKQKKVQGKRYDRIDEIIELEL